MKQIYGENTDSRIDRPGKHETLFGSVIIPFCFSAVNDELQDAPQSSDALAYVTAELIDQFNGKQIYQSTNKHPQAERYGPYTTIYG
jgi:hypothetical protein